MSTATDALGQGAAPEPMPEPVRPETTTLAPGLEVADLAPTGLAPAATGSPLSSLRARIAAAPGRDGLHLDLLVPRMTGVGVRYRPVSSVEMNAIGERVQANDKIEPSRKSLVINAAALGGACLGVFITDDDGQPVGDPSSWVRPGPRLAEELGKTQAELPTAADCIIELYRTEGDLMLAAIDLINWGSQESTHRKAPDPGE